MYDGGKMDGADNIPCTPYLHRNAQFKYVDNSQHVLDPYLNLAAQYGWANYMFQTNQGPSYPAHQFLFGGTFRPLPQRTMPWVSSLRRIRGRPAGGTTDAGGDTGCLAPLNEGNWLIGINSNGTETHLLNNPLGTFCFSHHTMAGLLDDAGLSWKYYAPDNIQSGWRQSGWVDLECGQWSGFQRSASTRRRSIPKCTGPQWAANVDLKPSGRVNNISAP